MNTPRGREQLPHILTSSLALRISRQRLPSFEKMTTDTRHDKAEPRAPHVEGTQQQAAKLSSLDDDVVVIDGRAIPIDSDELRDQMAAQIKATKVSFTSKEAFQLYFFLAVAYCSEFSHPPAPSTFRRRLTRMMSPRLMGHGVRQLAHGRDERQ